MKKFLLIGFVCCSLLLCTNHAIASGSVDCDGFFGKLWNACHGVTHPEREAPRGVGADILIHETEAVDFVAEYKYDGENEEHSIFAVVKTKKSLVDYAKDLFAKAKEKING